MVLSAMEKNKTGIGLCIRDIFTEKAISELSYWRGYLGEECGWTMDQQVWSPEAGCVQGGWSSGRVRESRKYDILVGGQIIKGL